jgi:hypothetical protein
VHRTSYYSLSCTPDMSLFTVMCTGHNHYSLSCAPDTVTIHYPVHRTQPLFTVLCTRHSYYSLSCAPNRVTIHCPVHRTSHYSLSCAPANSTLSVSPPFFLRLTSTFRRIFLRLKQTHLEYNTIDLVLETYIFLVILLAFLFLLQQSSKWYFLYRKS